jgi:hypothetical protein
LKIQGSKQKELKKEEDIFSIKKGFDWKSFGRFFAFFLVSSSSLIGLTRSHAS